MPYIGFVFLTVLWFLRFLLSVRRSSKPQLVGSFFVSLVSWNMDDIEDDDADKVHHM